MAALDWGLGHATRMVEMIQTLSDLGGTPVLASAGPAYTFWQQYFPELELYPLPAYAVQYRPRGNQVFGVMTQLPRISRVITAEQRWLRRNEKELRLDGVISDNRYGLWSSRIPSVMVCHQIAPSPGPPLNWLRQIAAMLHRPWLNRFSAVWVPDLPGEESLAGRLALVRGGLPPVRSVGWLSRFAPSQSKEKPKGPMLGIISGPEPHRELFANQLKEIFHQTGEPATLVLGQPGERSPFIDGKVEVYPHLSDRELGRKIQEARLVISRPGYSSLMDYTRLQPFRVLLVPTPGQGEQLYLANRCRQKGWAQTCSQDQLSGVKLGAAMNQQSGFPVTRKDLLSQALLNGFGKP